MHLRPFKTFRGTEALIILIFVLLLALKALNNCIENIVLTKTAENAANESN
jgi:hypothetical protein